jgi:cell division protein FtsL
MSEGRDINASSNTDSSLDGVRKWLSGNKIFFETIAASLLSLMAIIISVVQINIARQQTQLTELQTQIAQAQWQRDLQRAAIEKSAHWQRLRDGIWEIFDLDPKQGTHLLENLPAEQKVAWFRKIRSLLDAQTDNPVLIENRTCLGSWRNAISTAKTTADLFETTDMSTMTNFCSTKANSILRDIGYVWDKLVLDSEEVSPTGGRPSEAKK